MSNKELVIWIVGLTLVAVAFTLSIGPLLQGLSAVLVAVGDFLSSVLSGLAAIATGITAAAVASVTLASWVAPIAAGSLAVGGTAVAVYVFTALARRNPLESLAGVASIGGGYAATVAAEVSGAEGIHGATLTAFVSLLLFTAGLFVRQARFWWIVGGVGLFAATLILVGFVALSNDPPLDPSEFLSSVQPEAVGAIALLLVVMVGVGLISWKLRDRDQVGPRGAKQLDNHC